LSRAAARAAAQGKTRATSAGV